jgi:hypothetical protein
MAKNRNVCILFNIEYPAPELFLAPSVQSISLYDVKKIFFYQSSFDYLSRSICGG